MLFLPSPLPSERSSVSSQRGSFDSRFTSATDHPDIQYDVRATAYSLQDPLADAAGRFINQEPQTLYGLVHYGMSARDQPDWRESAFHTLALTAIARRNRTLPHFRERQYTNAPPDPLRRPSLRAPEQVHHEKSPVPAEKNALGRIKARGKRIISALATLFSRGKMPPLETPLHHQPGRNVFNDRRL